MRTNSSLSRRNFVKSAGFAGAATVLGGAPALLGKSARAKGKARNLIFLVADGMGGGSISLAHHWSLRHRSQLLNWTQLYQSKHIVRALQDTASASSPVTDSAAAASAWGCGQRINNGAINITPTGDAPAPLFVHARDAGKLTGLVTSCRVTHATPAGFAANVPSREQEDAIAVQYLEREIDVILGGGLRHFARSEEGREVDLLSGARSQGYQVARSKRELAKLSRDGRLLGLFSADHLPYAIDRENDESLAEVPSLEELFQAALANLSRSRNGFALQVEAGRIDHAGHANDPAGILREMLEFDRCIAIASAFYMRNPDTLVIITTDHGTGGCQLNGWGERYGYSGVGLDRINNFTASFEALQRRFQRGSGFEAAAFTQATGLPVSGAQEAAVLEAVTSGKSSLERAMTGVFSKELRDATAVGWTSNNHTSENVELFAFGPGAEAVPPFARNDQLFAVMADALALKV